VAQHDVVETGEGELRAEAAPRALAQLGDRALADLVGERLAGPHDVAVHLVGDVALRAGLDALEHVHGLAARPAERVHARVDDEARGAPRLRGEHAEAVERTRVGAQLVGEALGVVGPALDVGGEAAVLAELGEPVEVERERDLEVVPGHGLVERQRLELERGPRVGVARVGVEDAGREPSSAGGSSRPRGRPSPATPRGAHS
jgi:hypothetical protein